MDGLLWGQLAPWGIVAVIVGLILMGRLVPRQLLLDERKNTQEWKEAYQTEKATSGTLATTNAEILEHSRTTTAALTAMQKLLAEET